MLFTFPSRYWFTIGLSRVFSLGGWARRIHTGFHVSRATQDTATMKEASCKGLSPAMAALSSTFHSLLLLDIAVLQPRRGRNRSGLPGCPIRKSPDQRSFAPPRSLSQLITSFIACESLGIHRTPFLTSYRLSYRVICADYAESVLSFFMDGRIICRCLCVLEFDD